MSFETETLKRDKKVLKTGENWKFIFYKNVICCLLFSPDTVMCYPFDYLIRANVLHTSYKNQKPKTFWNIVGFAFKQKYFC